MLARHFDIGYGPCSFNKKDRYNERMPVKVAQRATYIVSDTLESTGRSISSAVTVLNVGIQDSGSETQLVH